MTKSNHFQVILGDFGAWVRMSAYKYENIIETFLKDHDESIKKYIKKLMEVKWL